MDEIKKPNIFFLLIDSFRSDKFYGKNKTSITPNLDSLIKKGVYFTQAINSSPASTSAISSILTAKWPHKVITSGKKNHELSHKEPNFINHLNELGYNTTALTPDYFTYAKLTTDFNESLQFNGGLYDGVGQQIIDILDKLESPWFFFIHLLDIHGTARKFPKQFDHKKFGFNGYERRISAMDPWFGKFFNKIDQNKTLMILTADHSTDRGIYTLKQEKLKTSLNQNNLQPFVGVASKMLFASLSTKLRRFYIDKKINTKKQKKYDALKNISELTVYEKRIQNNLANPSFSLFDDRFRIPLLFAGLGLKPKIIDQQIRSIDIFPSILDIIKVPSKIDIDGLSVLPLINGESFEEKPALIQIITNWLSTKSSSDINVLGIRFSGFKYFRSRENSNKGIHLYDLKNDPYEENNLALQKPEKVNEMELILSEIQNNDLDNFENESKNYKDLEENRRAEEELKKLGYL
jgi:arylsulfatase A-like enzyme